MDLGSHIRVRLDLPRRVLRQTFLGDLVRSLRQRREYRRWNERGRPVPPPHAVKQAVVREYARRFRLRTLVETGTYRGDMVYAMRSTFDRIYTIELDPTLHQQAVERFLRHGHISALRGNSGEVLEQVLRRISSPTLFWLDGHYSGGVTARGALDTPVLDELRAIFAHSVKDHAVLIDDARCFDGRGDYPTLDRLRELAFTEGRRRSFEVEDDIIRIR